jgi:hypothetical protein
MPKYTSLLTKNLRIPKRQSETINRWRNRLYNTKTKKDKKLKNGRKNTTQTTTDWATWISLKAVVHPCALEKQIPGPPLAPVELLLLKSSDKSWKRREGCDYGKQNTSLQSFISILVLCIYKYIYSNVWLLTW